MITKQKARWTHPLLERAKQIKDFDWLSRSGAETLHVIITDYWREQGKAAVKVDVIGAGFLKNSNMVWGIRSNLVCGLPVTPSEPKGSPEASAGGPHDAARKGVSSLTCRRSESAFRRPFSGAVHRA